MKHPTATLSNGARVANFSSPHSFTFTDGTVLPACDPDHAQLMMLESEEVVRPHPYLVGVTDVSLQFKLSDVVREALWDLEDNDDVDIILVPLPVMSSLKDGGWDVGKARVCRVSDRVSKVIYCDKFCL